MTTWNRFLLVFSILISILCGPRVCAVCRGVHMCAHTEAREVHGVTISPFQLVHLLFPSSVRVLHAYVKCVCTPIGAYHFYGFMAGIQSSHLITLTAVCLPSPCRVHFPVSTLLLGDKHRLGLSWIFPVSHCHMIFEYAIRNCLFNVLLWILSPKKAFWVGTCLILLSLPEWNSKSFIKPAVTPPELRVLNSTWKSAVFNWVP